MVEIISGITGAITLTKQLLQVASVVKDANAKLIVADLQVQLAELKVKLSELVEENDRLKRELARATSAVPEVQTGEDKLYYGASGDGPFCTTCYDADKKLIRLTEFQGHFKVFGKWRCNVCKGHYGRGQGG